MATKQVVFSQETTTVYYQKALKERVFVHYNSSFFVTGEKLYYKVYCIRARNNQLSNFSKVAYVELINAEKQVLFKHKVRLEKGVGNGAFFLPTSIPSGNYKLIAYTQWMRNEGGKSFFKGDITLVNTFQEDQFFNNKEPLQAVVKTTPVSSQKHIKIKATNSKKPIQLTLKKTTYKNREKVVVKLTSSAPSHTFGNYSISVRKIDSFRQSVKLTPKTYLNAYSETGSVIKKMKANFLPELKGDVLMGKVVHSATGIPVKGVKVVLSIPNKKFKFRFAITNDLGVFKFVFKTPHEDAEAVIQIVDAEKEKYKIKVFKQEPLKYKTLVFHPIEISSKTKKQLLEYSIQNQIENMYAEVKQDERLKTTITTPQFDNSRLYLLDDYTRFSTLKETILEIVKNVWISKKNKKYTFHVKNSDVYDEEKELPLVIVDGVFIQNHDEIVDFSAYKIKTISVVREKYLYGSYVFQGIVLIETFKGDYKKNETTAYLQNIHFDVPSINKYFYTQRYYNDTFDRIPDYRRQLLWMPTFDFKTNETTVDFYTSDVVGDFEIIVEGFNQKGAPVSLRTFFSVE